MFVDGAHAVLVRCLYAAHAALVRRSCGAHAALERRLLSRFGHHTSARVAMQFPEFQKRTLICLAFLAHTATQTLCPLPYHIQAVSLRVQLDLT